MKILGLFFATVAGTLSAWAVQPMSDWVNVKDFGARGDGVADDTAALQRCLDRLEDGMTVYVPRGTYAVSSTLVLRHPKKRLLGVSLVGDGADSLFLWKGPAFGRVIRLAGLAHSRFVDFTVDGGGVAAIGLWSDTEGKFQTQDRFQRLSLRNFRRAGFYSERNDFDGTSDSEPTFEHCLFEKCGSGIFFESWNDYDFSIRGCTFRDNKKVGIECAHGCFYASACRFERNAVDILANPPEHGSSVRRSVSVGSGVFLKGSSKFTPVTVENTTVADWTSPQGAIQYDGTLLAFNNTFEPGSVEKIYQTDHPRHFIAGRNAPNGARRPLRLPKDTVFRPVLATDGRIFDAKRDFGAKGDGNADDTEAVRAAIVAARAERGNAVVYLPKGIYRTTGTLEVGGADWSLRGCGISSVILYDGDPAESAIVVKDAGRIELALFRVQNRETFFGDHKCAWDGAKGANVLQLGGAGESRVTYREVFAYGKYEPSDLRNVMREGFVFRNLTARDKVNLHYVEGNLRFENCGDATVVGGVCYEGAIVVDGVTGSGFLCCQTRLATLVACPLVVRKNGSFVASDFYLEQEKDLLYRLAGSPDLPRGRITLGHPKVSRELKGGFHDCNPDRQRFDFMADEGWCGDFNLVAPQFYKTPARVAESAFSLREGICVNLIAPVFFGTTVLSEGRGALSLFGGWGDLPETPKNAAPTSAIALAFDDLTRLGELDLEFNYGRGR